MYGQRSHAFLAGVIFLLVSQWLYPQVEDCTLDIAGQDTDIIVDIFQMNDDQKTRLETLIAELEFARRPLEEEQRRILNEHPQSTESDLHNLAKKYSILNNKLVDLSVEYDQMLLGIFNDKQFAYYISLCEEAARRPLNPIRLEEEEEE